MRQTLSTKNPQNVQVFIPAALNRPTHTLYSICVVVHPMQQEWTINRRYSQFHQLRQDLFPAVHGDSLCPNCITFTNNLMEMSFPSKSPFRTNRNVRKRVTVLQEFLRSLVQVVFLREKPECRNCGLRVREVLRAFLLRGAQPVGTSDLCKIHTALCFHQNNCEKERGMNEPESNQTECLREVSAVESDRDPRSQSYAGTIERISFPSNNMFESSDDKCHDDALPLEEAMKQVVIAEGSACTKADIMERLSSMWVAYESHSSDSSRLSMGTQHSFTL
uniref:Uncharacterized protein AlNc14C12G1422 n=1 Tax=Albugo laibachii Nc14 TaxID=890382 RepID=F0W344_9STRA|nr:conserved hypothetical protein [Albugo laibachii Nc14]|eukprot:CCA15484.1 conserved hypothetical protein [Albugo laibachii Nc14]